ncbi:MAG: cytochrome C peroxidase [Byssovorax sp.]
MLFVAWIRRFTVASFLPRAGAVLASPLALLSCAVPAGDAPPAPAPVELAAAPAPVPVLTTSTPAPRAPAAHPLVGVARAGEAGSRVALGKLGTRRLAFVADEDDQALHTIDLESGVDLARTPLAATPSEVVIGPDGRVYVGLRSASAIAVLGSSGAPEAPLAEESRLPTGAEPVGLTLTPDGATLLVTTGISHELKAFSLASGQSSFTTSLPREPRSLVVLGDGSRAFVAHAAGSTVSAVDLLGNDHPITSVDVAGQLVPYQGLCAGPPRRVRGEPVAPITYRAGTLRGVQGFGILDVAGTILVPQVNAWSHDGQTTTPSYGPERGVSEISRIAAIDGRKAAIHPDSVSIPGVQGTQCLLPRAVVKHPTHKSVLVACLGIDSVVEMMLSLDGMNFQPISDRTWAVPAGPEGLAVDPESRIGVVFSQFARQVTILDLHDREKSGPFARPEVKARSIALTPLPVARDTAFDLGRRLFHAAGDHRLSRDGRACASCHPDGRDDGLVWSTPRGLRQTPMLAGRAVDTAPYGWEGARSDLREHIVNTVERRLVGSGLADAELDALVAYVKDLPGPAAPPRPKSAAETRGEALFRSGEVGCARCHDGAAHTDKQAHDIQSGGAFDTPSLRFVGGTAPYFHDGRYPTLRALLADTDGRMGHTGQLEEAELGDLESYLRSL